ncbi:choline ABC transporter substrate-binding protein [Salinivibrio kushneri]|nr:MULTISPECIES: choline ABC transporter substrate-binding protein [Salinivibrio]WBA13005.1 choline ABC transporter substrate-binding protein [Salinivibrio kushneri]
MSMLVSNGALAQPERCETISFADVGWTDITATTALASVVLDSIGYKTESKLLTIPVTLKSLANGDVDVFLGNWMPTMEADIAPYRDANSIDLLGKNLDGAKYTLSVPQYVYDAGVTNFKDISEYADKFEENIYGIEPGNDGNRLIQSMIDKNAFGLKDFELVSSSEAGMLSQVSRAVKRGDWIVFLGWEPHPMNARFDLAYLDGGDDYFGPNYGGATVHTNTRKNFTKECPNAGRFIDNIQFTLTMENEVMTMILDDGQKPEAAARAWLAKHPKTLNTWLEGIKTTKGQPAIEVAKSSLK